jgi:hypothetical protein
MIRALYTICLVGLIGSTAWAATGLKGERHQANGALGIVILAVLQR